MKSSVAALLAALMLLCSVGCQSKPSTAPSTTTPPSVPPTPMDDGSVIVAADSKLFAGVVADPFEKKSYQNPDAPAERRLKLEYVTYILSYKDSGPGQGIDSDLDRYVSDAGTVSVWYRASTDQVVAAEISADRDYARSGEAALVVKSDNLLRTLCNFDFKSLTRSYTYKPKIEATQERLATVRYENKRPDGRSYRYANVDYHVNMISIEIGNEPEPDEQTVSRLEAANDRLRDYLLYTRPEKDPVITEVGDDPAPEIFFKEGRWVLQTKRRVTYLVGKNEMEKQVVFTMWEKE